MVAHKLSCLLLLGLCCLATVVTAQGPKFEYPASFGSSNDRAWGGAESRTGNIWANARTFLPRMIDVAGEAFGALLIPTLLVLGFQAVWPRRTHYNVVKRSTDALGSESSSPAAAPMDDLVAHLTNIYYAATESDECIQRIVCELGATAKSMKPGNKNLMISILGKAASNKYSKLFSRFQDGVNTANCKKIGCKLID